MKLLKNIALTCLLITLSVSLFACGEVPSTKVYNSYETLATSNAKMFKDKNLHINFDEDVYDRIKECGDNYFTDLINVYEVTSGISMQFFNNYKSNLNIKDEKSEIKAKDSSALYELFKVFKDRVADCETAVSALEYYKSYFTEKDSSQQYTYRFVETSTIKNKMQVLYNKYDALIESAFDFNNYFVNVYTENHPLVDYRKDELGLDKATIKNAYDYTISRVLDVVFNLKDEDDGEKLSKVLKIASRYQAVVDNIDDETRIFSEIINDASRNASMISKLCVLQNNLDVYLNQKDKYETAKEKLKGKLSDLDKNAYEQVVNEFENGVLLDTINSLSAIVDEFYVKQ